MRAFCVEGDPLAKLANVTPADLAPWGWAGFIDDAIGLERLARYFTSRDLPPPRLALRCSSVAALFAAVAAGGSDLLVHTADTLAPEATRRGLVPLPLELPMWSFPTGLACRPAANHLATVRHLKAALSG